MLNGVGYNHELIENGVWRQLKLSWFCIASVECSKFKSAIYQHRGSSFTDEEFCDILSKSILLGWRDVKQPNGSVLPYSNEMAKIALLTNDDVRQFVDSVSTDLTNFIES